MFTASRFARRGKMNVEKFTQIYRLKDTIMILNKKMCKRSVKACLLMTVWEISPYWHQNAIILRQSLYLIILLWIFFFFSNCLWQFQKYLHRQEASATIFYHKILCYFFTFIFCVCALIIARFAFLFIQHTKNDEIPWTKYSAFSCFEW